MAVATIRGRLFFFCACTTCSYYPKAATIQCAATIRVNTVFVERLLHDTIFTVLFNVAYTRIITIITNNVCTSGRKYD